MSRLRLPLTFALLCCAAAQTGLAADEKFAWKTPFELDLPEPTRTITLKTGTDAMAFAAANGLDGARILPMGRRGSILEVPMDEDGWRQVSESLCSGPDVAACDTAVCQGIQLSGTANPGSSYSAESVQARLVQNPPEKIDVPDAADGEAGSCRGPALIPPLDQAGAAGTGPNLTIDLSLIDQSPASKPAAVATGPDSAPSADAQINSQAGLQAGPEADQTAGTQQAGQQPAQQAQQAQQADQQAVASPAPTAEKRGFQFSLNSGFAPGGGVDLGTDELPADTSDWTLVVGAGCTEIKVPLDSIEPARMPGIVVALVDAANVQAVAGTYGLAVVRQLTLNSTGQNLVVYATAQNIFTVIAAMAADARVDGAQQEFVYRTTAQAADPLPGEVVAANSAAVSHTGYSDPFASLNYGPGMTRALELHPSAAGSGQLVAVIDTGIDTAHPDLQGRLREPVDTTGEGYGPEIHGTAVAGIIAAEADNAIGSYGVAPAAEILPIKACHPQEPGGLSARCTTSSLVKALDVAMVENAGIINMSLAGPPDDLLGRFIFLALQQDRLIIAGAGNGGEHAKPGFPAAIPGVLAVTAVDVADRLYRQANRGDYIDVAAPGVDIISTAPDGRYPPLSGTSMAAAHVTGVAALLRELGPLMSSREVAQVIRSHTRDLGVQGADPSFGAGLVDACQSASAATAQAVVCNTGEHDAVFDSL